MLRWSDKSRQILRNKSDARLRYFSVSRDAVRVGLSSNFHHFRLLKSSRSVDGHIVDQGLPVATIIRGISTIGLLKSTASENNLLLKERDRSQLRALLREASYLPDLHARAWVIRHIIFRYKQYDSSALDEENPAEVTRIAEKRIEARKALSKLCRANEGERKILLKILLLAYGRTGRRKRELMQPLVKKNNHDADVQFARGQLFSATQKSERDAAIASDIELLPSQLQVLARSQIAAAPPLWLGSNPRRLTADVPPTNAWGRPMPANRRKNMVKKWYANLLQRVRPPLPEDEWNDLKAKARGKIDLDLPVQRRSPARCNASRLSPLTSVVMSGKAPDRLFKSSAGGRIDRRFMRRIYETVFAECAAMTWDAEKKYWAVSWGVNERNQIE